MAHSKVGSYVNMGGNFVVEEGGQVGNYANGGGSITVGKYGCIPAYARLGGGVKIPPFGSVALVNWRWKPLPEITDQMYVLQPSGECQLSPRYELVIFARDMTMKFH